MSLLDQMLVTELERRGLDLPEGALAKFEIYLRELVEWNKRLNLHGFDEEGSIITHLFLDSLAPLFRDPLLSGSLLDVGTGAGCPGIPLKLMREELHASLLDARKKKIDFLEHVVSECRLEGVTLLWARAEEAARDPKLRGSFDTVTVKAVGRLNVIAEVALPFVKSGGVLIAYKGESYSAELEEAELAIGKCGGEFADAFAYRLPEIREERRLIIIRKVKPTPEEYPRRSGIPFKRPL